MSADIEDVRKAYKAKDFRTAMELARPLADAGDMRAQFTIGLMLVSGQGVPANPEQGLRLIKLAADAGVADAQAAVAATFLLRGFAAFDPSAARAWAEKAAAQNSDPGHYVLSLIYLNGLGVPQDAQTGLDHLRRAASNGIPLAKYELGKALLLGRGTARDEAQGTALAKEAAAADARLTEQVELILAKVNQLWQLQKGDVLLTCTSFACAWSTGSNRKRLRAYMDEYKWAELAAKVLEVGESTELSYFYLGRALEGLGNLLAAKQYYRIALDPRRNGRPCAGLINNCDGSVFPRDINERLAAVDAAEKYATQQLKRQDAERLAMERAKAEEAVKASEAQRLAEQTQALASLSIKASDGDRDAQYQLAQHYFKGNGGITSDATAGVTWLTKAAEGGFAAAQFELGQRLLSGNDIDADERLAESWLQKAEAQGHQQAEASIAELRKERQRRAMRAEQARQAKEREIAATVAAAARKTKEEQVEIERKRREENVEKLRAL